MADSTLKYPPWRSGAVALICVAQRAVGAILDHLSEISGSGRRLRSWRRQLLRNRQEIQPTSLLETKRPRS